MAQKNQILGIAFCYEDGTVSPSYDNIGTVIWANSFNNNKLVVFAPTYNQ